MMNSLPQERIDTGSSLPSIEPSTPSWLCYLRYIPKGVKNMNTCTTATSVELSWRQDTTARNVMSVIQLYMLGYVIIYK